MQWVSSRQGSRWLGIQPLWFVAGFLSGCVLGIVMLQWYMEAPLLVMWVSSMCAPVTAYVACLGSHLGALVGEKYRSGYWDGVYLIGSLANGLVAGWLGHLLRWSWRESRKLAVVLIVAVALYLLGYVALLALMLRG